MDKYFLITTALEETWSHDDGVIFLGGWAKKYDRRNVWSKFKSMVASPFCDNERQREMDFLYIQSVTKCLLGEVSKELNKLHSVQYSEKQWGIILGHWLSRYVSLAFNRYFTIESVFNDYDISSTIVLEYNKYSLATCDSLEFIWASNDDVWNHVFFSKVLRFLECKVETKKGDKCLTRFSHPVDEDALKKSIYSKASNVVKKTLSLFNKQSDAFIVNSYLPVKEEIKLYLSLGQCPQFWSSPPLEPFEPEKKLRKHLDFSYSEMGFEKFVRELLSEVIPSCYVEGFIDLQETVKRLPWPKQPKFIYTANNFDVDEVFKLWVAERIEKGVPYYVGQHGAGYGTHKYFQTQYAPEQVVADKFITWGWENSIQKYIPAYVFTVASRKRKVRPNDGGLLLIEASPPHRLSHWDNYYEFSIFQEAQFEFTEALSLEIQEFLTVRLHGAYKYFDWSDAERWSERSPITCIDRGITKISNLMSENRLIVHGYDSTGILECMALNIPILAFWHGGLEHLLPTARPHYQLLIDAGILFTSPIDTAKKVIEIWDDVEGWWGQEYVQEARRRFCDKYARVSNNPVRDLKEILLS